MATDNTEKILSDVNIPGFVNVGDGNTNTLTIDIINKRVGINKDIPTRTLDVNGSMTANEMTVNSTDYEPIPSGVIIMWNSTTLPSNGQWVLCNGLNGTPNLVNHYVIGANGDSPTSPLRAGILYGQNTLSVQRHPKHAHTMNTQTANHGHNGSLSFSGHHIHYALYSRVNGYGNASGYHHVDSRDANEQMYYGKYSALTDELYHTHNLNHSQSGQHSHNWNGMGQTGNTAAFSIEPSHRTILFIMKT